MENRMLENFSELSEKQLGRCLPKEPLVKLQEGARASVLNYNVPQSTCFSFNNYLDLKVAGGDFLPQFSNPPADHFWQSIENVTVEQVAEALRVSANTAVSSSIRLEEITAQLKEQRAVARTVTPTIVNEPDVPVTDPLPVVGNDIIPPDNVIAEQVTLGFRPYFKRNIFGKRELRFAKQPATPVPTILIVEHYKVCSFLGDYGAGKTLRTFTLLPGEKTEITLKTYKKSTEISKKSENVLDSFTENSTKELEKLIEDENNNSSSVGTEETEKDAKQIAFGVSGGASGGIPGQFGVKIDASYNNSTSRENSSTMNADRSESLKQLNRAMDRHVAESSAVREVEVNTETSTTTETGEESQIIRTLENINKSRVLNFVFRQLLQEYFTVTYLDDISIVFSNGYPESKRVTKLSNLEGFLKGILQPTKVNDIRDKILNELSSIYDYQGNRVRFVEKVTQNITDITDNVIGTQVFYRKKQGLTQTYRDKTVEGIILSVENRVLRTDSLIVDAVLGQGEALDCFNLKLQEAANMKAYLENFTTYLQQAEKQQAMDIIEQLKDAELKATLYKKIFGDCCTSDVIVPQ